MTQANYYWTEITKLERAEQTTANGRIPKKSNVIWANCNISAIISVQSIKMYKSTIGNVRLIRFLMFVEQ